MTEGDIKHRLAALLSADVVGYSRLMAEDEVATIRTLSASKRQDCIKGKPDVTKKYLDGRYPLFLVDC